MRSFCLLASCFLFICGCTTLDMVFNPSQYEKKTSPPQRISEIVYDTIKIYNSDGEMKTGIKGLPQRRITFTQIGQSYTIRSGEVAEFVFEGVDFGQATFDVVTNLDTKEITLALVHRDTSKIFLSSKCQTVKRLGTGFLPSIEVSSDLKPEQIVITPVFNDNCEVIGYEIRYGAEERGCKSVAQAVLKQFYNCTKNNFGNPPKKLKSPCLNAKFGLPCN